MEITVTVEITAVEFRRLNSFEWAVLNILNAFHGNAPSIEEVAAQFCIGSPVFLAAALQSLRSAGAVKEKTDELREPDLKDFELSEIGVTAIREDGWESGPEETFSDSIRLDWPSLCFRSHRESGDRGQLNLSAPALEDVHAKVTPEKLEEWLKQNNNPRCWRVKASW
ncbi:MAG TPA: hypothetical protein VNU68_30860 [Verrucomicrobiae bacterium]|nr:hypothetical protein [Verrucomicrobiae bacterium]